MVAGSILSNYEYNRATVDAAVNSNWSKISLFNGATLDFAITQEERSSVDDLTYATARYAFVLACTNTCNSVSSGNSLDDGKY